jgi:N-carbamoyl-L-amino-acid hydrolase
MTLAITIDQRQLSRELEQLAQFSDCPDPMPAVTRVVYTEPDRQARAYLNERYQQARLEVRVDAIGNTFARWPGSDPQLPIVGTGWHIDAIPYSGMYDGTVGVLGGLEAIRSLQRSGYQPRRSIELLMFSSEEPTRFGVGCSGSRLLSGAMAGEVLAEWTDAQGKRLDAVRREAGMTGDLPAARLPVDYYHAWVELHIEQGPILEQTETDIGIVRAIAAPAGMSFQLTGQGGHAGSVLMTDRRDALCAAAEIISLIERAAQASASPDLVATVGRLAVHPNAVNSIPSRVEFTLDIRDIDAAHRDQCIRQIMAEAQAVAARRGLTLEVTIDHADPPAAAAGWIMEQIEAACREASVSYRSMISRAYHDSLFMARIAPCSMIFIPCRLGVSHRPDEYAAPEQIRRGVEVLARSLARLAA